ncbi:unnamed protein product [Mesocestoides corti]|uniref:Uncharacterized protein n=1 Tax=Mesocestoides corti TaxID=53468 RepID=A0A0R3U577_MESCO|nr:unnamed protein product [Mesocestoides corti]
MDNLVKTCASASASAPGSGLKAPRLTRAHARRSKIDFISTERELALQLMFLYCIKIRSLAKIDIDAALSDSTGPLWQLSSSRLEKKTPPDSTQMSKATILNECKLQFEVIERLHSKLQPERISLLNYAALKTPERAPIRVENPRRHNRIVTKPGATARVNRIFVRECSCSPDAIRAPVRCENRAVLLKLSPWAYISCHRHLETRQAAGPFSGPQIQSQPNFPKTLTMDRNQAEPQPNLATGPTPSTTRPDAVLVSNGDPVLFPQAGHHHESPHVDGGGMVTRRGACVTPAAPPPHSLGR